MGGITEEKIAESMPPCIKSIASLRELIGKCTLVQECYIVDEKQEHHDGYLSFSINDKNQAVFCTWKKLEDNKIKFVNRVGLNRHSLLFISKLSDLEIG